MLKKNSMKKIMFLMMLFGLFFITAGNVSAQNCVPKDNQVAVYDDWKFGGDCKVLNVGDYASIVTAAKFENDVVSSVKVGKNVKAMLCEHIDFGGVCQTFEADNEFLEGSQIENDRVSSIKVIAKTAASDNKGNNNSANANKPGCSMDKGGKAIPIKWVNKTKNELRFMWINFDCEEEDRGTIKPGETFEQSSYNGHVFQIYYYASESDEPRWVELKKVTVSPSNKSMNLTMQ